MGACTWTVLVVMVAVGMEKQGNAFNFLPVSSKGFSGPPGAQFGFSIALWNDTKGVKRLVVGAPRGNQTNWGDDTFPLGVAYLCEPDLREAHSDDGGGDDGGGDGGGDECSVHPDLLPVSKEPQKQMLLSAYDYTLRLHGIGIGETIVTQKNKGHRLVVCAPRYPVPYQENIIESDGVCYFMEEPSHVKTNRIPGNLAFRGSLMGYSAATDEVSVVMGGPMSYAGCGILLRCTNWRECRFYNKYHSSKGNKTIEGVIKDCADWNEGWAVQVGRYEGPHADLTIATSSPKSLNYMGEIKFYRYLSIPRPWETPIHIIRGGEIGAFFGYALTSADVDGDGTTDLLVGAPFARDERTDEWDVGKVFVHYAPLAQHASSLVSKVLVGEGPRGRFGSSLASLGDVDDDGYEDVAVGAPYGGVDGSGVVYIYNGGSNGLRTDWPKVITASEYFPGSRGFGFSIDGGLDMDKNGYPDIAIGALHSDSAVLIRASPVVRMQGSVSFNSPTINIKENLCNLDLAGHKKLRGVCFFLTVNFTYNSITTFDELKLRYEMELSIDKERTKFGFSHNTAKMDTADRPIYKNNSRPWSLKVFVQRARSNVNLTISAKVSAKVSNYTPEGIPPVLDFFGPPSYTTSTKLVCKNTTCTTEPDLALHAFGAPVTLGDTPMTVSLNVTLEVKNDPAYGIQVKVHYPEHLTYQEVDGTEVLPDCRGTPYDNLRTCIIEEGSADETISFWLVFRYDIADMEKLLPGINFTLAVNNDVKSDTNMSNNRVDIVITTKTNATLYPQDLSKTQSSVVMVNHTATEEDLKAVEENAKDAFPVDKLGPRLVHILSLTNRGPSPVMHAKLKFHVPLYFGKARLTYFMDQPKASPGVTCTDLVEINPLGLQPPQVPVFSEPSVTTTATSSFTSFTKTSEAQSHYQREKREAEETSSPLTTDAYSDSSTFPSSFQWTTDPAEYFSTTFDPVQSKKPDDDNALECKDARCLVTCSVDLIPALESVNVTFTSYLVTATVNKLGVHKIFVKTWITPEILQNGSTIINPTLPATTKVFLERPPKRGFSAVPLWILIVSIVVAILVILIIICVLQKVGFFKRNRAPKGFERQKFNMENKTTLD